MHELQGQVQNLAEQLADLRAEELRDRAEARELRQELELARVESRPRTGPAGSHDPYLGLSPQTSASLPTASATPDSPQEDQPTEARLARLEESQQLADARIAEQSQTKVESGSKYRVRLSGIVLLNFFDNQGVVDNQDFPQIATPRSAVDSAQSLGGLLRQSQIGVEVFGPEIAGARTSADVKFDFAGGFTDVPNGVAMGIVRLRTGTFRMDWTSTSIVAGQDRLWATGAHFARFARRPGTLLFGKSMAWTPQVRVEHRIALSDVSHVLLQAGILDSLSGELPLAQVGTPPGASNRDSRRMQGGLPGRIAPLGKTLPSDLADTMQGRISGSAAT